MVNSWSTTFMMVSGKTYTYLFKGTCWVEMKNGANSWRYFQRNSTSGVAMFNFSFTSFWLQKHQVWVQNKVLTEKQFNNSVLTQLYQGLRKAGLLLAYRRTVSRLHVQVWRNGKIHPSDIWDTKWKTKNKFISVSNSLKYYATFKSMWCIIHSYH